MWSPKIKVQKKKNWKPSRILVWVSEILKFTQGGHRHLIFEKDSGVGPKDCWKIQATANWRGMGRPSRGAKEASAVSLRAEKTPYAWLSIHHWESEPENLTILTRICQSGLNPSSRTGTFMGTYCLPRSSTETWKCMPWLGCFFHFHFEILGQLLEKIKERCDARDCTFSPDGFLSRV